MECPYCGGEGESLGTLGHTIYMRCRACGMDYSDVSGPEKCDEEPEFNEEEFENQENGGYLDWGD